MAERGLSQNRLDNLGSQGRAEAMSNTFFQHLQLRKARQICLFHDMVFEDVGGLIANGEDDAVLYCRLPDLP
jgi:hypothetical protein